MATMPIKPEEGYLYDMLNASKMRSPHTDRVGFAEQIIPVISFYDLYSPSLAKRRRLAQQVRYAFQTTSIFYAVNHGVPESLTRKLHSACSTFFGMAHEEKMVVSTENSEVPARGYRFHKQGRICDAAITDLPETFEMIASPCDKYGEFPALEFEPGTANLWPTWPMNFEEVVCTYNKAMHRLAVQFLRIIALALRLEETALDHILNPFCGITCLKYPKFVEGMPHGKGLHTDFSIFTILTQLTSHSGLEFLHTDGQYVSVPPRPKSLVIQVGDLLDKVSSSVFRAVPHRVVVASSPEAALSGRLSVAYFADADPEAYIVPINSEGGSAGEEFVAGELFNELWSQPRYKRLRDVEA